MKYTYNWGPYYWFFLHTIAYNYPLYPNKIIKRKYFDLIQNMPLFIPDEKIAAKFQIILRDYPVSPYLNNRDDLTHWMHFIHNIINKELNKKCVPYYESYDLFNEKYNIVQDHMSIYERKKYSYYHNVFIFICIILLFFFISIIVLPSHYILYLYNLYTYIKGIWDNKFKKK